MSQNIFVNKDKITGVFDWGCALYGDHLYDLALFEFWAPWYPHLNIAALRLKLEQRWIKINDIPPNKESRLIACY